MRTALELSSMPIGLPVVFEEESSPWEAPYASATGLGRGIGDDGSGGISGGVLESPQPAGAEGRAAAALLDIHMRPDT